MIYTRDSIDYHVNLESLHEMEECVPMTLSERNAIRLWAKIGHDIDSNPWKMYESDGHSMNYLKALRIRRGSSHGPWDSWEYASFSCTRDEDFYAIQAPQLSSTT